MKEKSIWLNEAWLNFRASWATWLFAVTLIIVLPLCFRALTVDELGLNMYMALFGVLITAFITNLLLRNQSAQKQAIQKSAKVYTEKIETYKEFLDKLEILLTTENPSEKEVDALTMLFMKMSIHTDYKKLDEISKKFSDIFNDKFKKAERNASRSWRQGLLEIAHILHCELYSIDASQTVSNEIGKEKRSIMDYQQVIAAQLNELEGNLIEEKQNEGEEADASCADVRSEYNESKQQSQLVVCKEMEISFHSLFKEENGWTCGIEINGNDENFSGVIATLRSEIPNIRKVFIGFKEGRAEGWFFQFHADFEDDNLRRQCYLAMRREFGGRICKWSWWKPFPQEWAERLKKNTPDAELQRYIMETLTKVYNWVLGYKKIMMLYSKYSGIILDSPAGDGWKPGIWANHVWNFFHSRSPLYLDIDYADNSTELRIWITNRNHNAEELKKQLAEVLPEEKFNAPLNKEPYFHLHKEHLTEAEVVKELKVLLPKLAACGN